jgi:phenylacetate-CoA ligase
MLSQTGDLRWDFQYVSDSTLDHLELEASLALVIGEGARVNAFRRRSIPPAASGKFSLVKPLSKV